MYAVLVHGWRGWPENAWFPWLRMQLEARGWTVIVPALPNPMVPERTAWVAAVEMAIQSVIDGGVPASKITLVGHSLGCLTILRALERHEGKPFANVVLVSGFGRNFGAFGLGPWFDHPLKFDLIRATSKRWGVLHGEGDVIVPVQEGKWLADQLGVPVTRTEWPGHFMHEEGVTQLPEVLDALF